MYRNLVETSRHFRAMNTEVEIIVCSSDNERSYVEEAVYKAQLTFLMIERQLSRFNPMSELSRLNAAHGQTFKASQILVDVTGAALNAAKITNGLFDPTMLPDLLRAGYDRSFEQLSSVPENTQKTADLPRRFSWKDIDIDPSNHTITLPDSCQIDLGGIGKGWTVDRIARELRQFDGFAVDAGGDICVGGRSIGSPLWSIGIANPFEEDKNVAVIELGDGAVCTSSVTRRKWVRGGEECHHIIDPRTGSSAVSGIVSASIQAQWAVRAEIIAKAVIILGKQRGIDFINGQNGVSGLIMLDDGAVIRTAGFNEACHAA